MSKIGIVSCDTLLGVFAVGPSAPHYTKDDIHLVRHLISRGHDVAPLLWGAPMEECERYDMLLVRSTWDYFERRDEFLQWLHQLDASKSKVQNPTGTMLCNIDKHYLRDFATQGIPVIPTIYIERDDPQPLHEHLATVDWDEFEIKPTISGGSYLTSRVQRDALTSFEETFQTYRAEHAWMLQPFMQEIVEQGEWTLVYFGGEYAHTILKTPKDGDYRVQEEFGGSVHFTEPPKHLREQVDKVVDTIPYPWTYARIDGCMVNETFTLIECELIEPELFLRASPTSVEQFTRVIEQHIHDE